MLPHGGTRPLLAAGLCLALLAACPCSSEGEGALYVEVDARARPSAALLAAERDTAPFGDQAVAVSAGSASVLHEVLAALNGRPYALVYDEPDNLLRLDRSEITDGLVLVSPARPRRPEAACDLMLGDGCTR
jgi:hypothetical protein